MGMAPADDVNPYQAPCSNRSEPTRTEFNVSSAKRLYMAWFFIFALNLIAPLYFGWRMTEDGGRIGMLLAAILLLAVGYWICASARELGFALVVGGVAVALSQVLPMLQIMAGALGCALAVAMGLHSNGDAVDSPPMVVGEVGGFVVTLITGSLLMGAALVTGLALRALRAAFR